MMQGAANTKVPVLPVVHLAQVIGAAARLGVVGVVAGSVVMLLIRWRGWAWTCGVPLLMAAPAAVVLGWRAAVCCDACAASTVGGGLWRHLVDLRAGGDLADRARDRIGPMTPYRRWRGWRSLRAGEWLTDEGVVIGFSRKGELVRVPIACGRAVMGIVVGATGSGKTILMLLLALAAIKRGSGVIFIDPKGDDYVLEQLREAAARRRGGDGRVADSGMRMAGELDHKLFLEGPQLGASESERAWTPTARRQRDGACGFRLSSG